MRQVARLGRVARVFDERADDLDAPGGNAQAQLYGGRIAALLYDEPPGRCAYGNGAFWREDLGQVQEAGGRELRSFPRHPLSKLALPAHRYAQYRAFDESRTAGAIRRVLRRLFRRLLPVDLVVL